MTTLPAHTAPPAPPNAPPAADALETPALAPVAPAERFGSIDVLRGVAVLGILAMNIIAFALPSTAYLNPMAEGIAPFQGEFTGVNAAAWWVQHVVFDMKFITVFSMLFGAGLVLMDRRADARAGQGEPGARSELAGVYYRRLLVLIMVGLVHAYAIWFGDVLFMYGVCGLVLYPMRRWQPRTLIAVGLLLVVFCMALSTGFGLLTVWLRDQAETAQAMAKAGETVSKDQQGLIDAWRGARESFDPSPATALQEVEAMRGPIRGVLLTNGMHALMFHLFMLPFFFVWRTIGIMMIGMALMKLGVFSAERSGRFYRGLVLVGYGLGLPLAVLSGLMLVQTRFDMIGWYLYTGHFNAIASLVVALGHIGAVMLIWRAGALRWITTRLGAVGRMAFTNYLAQSIICTTIFYGWGLGYFGSLERAELMLVVLGVWLAQLAWSPWWLARYRFGPAEWCWRSLTYMKAQPMKA